MNEVRSVLIKYLNFENDPSTPNHAKKAIALVLTAASLLYAPATRANGPRVTATSFAAIVSSVCSVTNHASTTLRS